MIRYVFKDSPVTIKNAKVVDPQKIGEALAAIAKDAGGELRPQKVWQAAQAKNHPLHPCFEWDVHKAAEAHWTEQARAIIRCVRVLDEETDKAEPAFLSVSTDRGGVSYRSLGDVKSSTDLQLAVLKSAERDLDAFERRYRDLTEVCDLVRAARTTVRKRREKMESRAAA